MRGERKLKSDWLESRTARRELFSRTTMGGIARIRRAVSELAGTCAVGTISSKSSRFATNPLSRKPMSLILFQCLGGNALSSICRLFCEDYEGRSSGVPDLIVWNFERKECKFVEVKGPGDSLQENQKVNHIIDIIPFFLVLTTQ
jgi:hypothetical protein